MFREVRVFEVREVLRLWMRNEGAGTSATTYNPGGAVRRDHMAS
jgi:hypothetical protein